MDGTFMPMNNNIDPSLRSSVRYNLVHKMMEENFTKWLSQQSTANLIQKLMEDCKKPNINLSTPSPIFVTKLNSLNQSQTLNQQFSFMPPVSPNSSALINYQNEKRNMLTESQILKEEKKKVQMTDSISNSLSQLNLDSNSGKNKIPQFYFGEGHINSENLENDKNLINQFFTKEELTREEFTNITVDVLNFPKLFNTVLFKKITIYSGEENMEKISKKIFLKFHKDHFEGKDEYKRFFNLINNCEKNFHQNPDKNYLSRADFVPFIKALLEFHPGLEFLKSHPDFQEKYTDTVIMRIFYTCDLNDDGKLTYREFRKSNIVSVLKKVCEEPDINKMRDYFSYEHFYVLYCLFWDLDGNEHDFLIDKEEFSKYIYFNLIRGMMHMLCREKLSTEFLHRSPENLNQI